MDIIKILLTDPKADPSADNNRTIRLVSENGHYEIINLLLEDEWIKANALRSVE